MNWRVFGNSVLLPIISEGSLLWFVRRPSAYSPPEGLDPILKHHDTRGSFRRHWPREDDMFRIQGSGYRVASFGFAKRHFRILSSQPRPA
jgi:hypothetical protein